MKSSVPTASSAPETRSVLPVVALAERAQERRRLPGAERDPERVFLPQLAGRVLRAALLHLGAA